VRELINRGANVHAMNPSAFSALREACMNGHSEAIRLLLAAGADPAIKDCYGRDARENAYLSSFEYGDGILEVRQLFPAPRRGP